jgi:hypothetical protein
MRIVIAAFLAAFSFQALAHENYSDWKRPDTQTSCCSDKDCYPTRAEFRAGRWFAKRREDGKWLPVPSHLILKDQASEDGNAHICAPPPSDLDIIYCFVIPNSGS